MRTETQVIVTEQPKPITYSVGDKFLRDGNIYVLSKIDNSSICALININNGFPWNFIGFKVANMEAITEDEFKKLTGHNTHQQFKLIKTLKIEATL